MLVETSEPFMIFVKFSTNDFLQYVAIIGHEIPKSLWIVTMLIYSPIAKMLTCSSMLITPFL
jgi:hypothetical protein